MLTLDQVAVLPDGQLAQVSGAVVEMLRRLKDGDNVLGWEGDPNMELFVDLDTGLFDVWTLDLAGEPTLVVSAAPYCDQRLLERVIRADTRRFDVAQRVIDARAAREKAEASRLADQREEAHDKLHLALLQDIGAYEGGLTKRIFPVGGD